MKIYRQFVDEDGRELIPPETAIHYLEGGGFIKPGTVNEIIRLNLRQTYRTFEAFYMFEPETKGGSE